MLKLRSHVKRANKELILQTNKLPASLLIYFLNCLIIFGTFRIPHSLLRLILILI
jgi:hypothetical protein